MTKFIFLALAYFVTGWLGLQLPYAGSHITLVWLPTGIAVAALLRWGRPVWPGVTLGAFLVNLSIGSPWLLAASWLRRTGFHPAFDRQTDVGSFIAAAGAGMVISASGGVASLYLAGLLPVEASSSAWLSWWMGDTVGVLLAAPLLLTLTRRNIGQLWRTRRKLLAWMLVAGPVAWFAFIHDYEQAGRSLPLAFLTLPLLAWAALRFGNTGAALAGLGFSVVAAWSTATGHSLFLLSDMHISLFMLWGYMATIVLTGLLIIALQAERLQVESTQRESEEKLRGLFELSPLGIALTDMKGRYVEFNEAFCNICGYPAEELKALDYWTLTPGKYAADEALQLASLERTGRYGPYEKEYIRKDGSLISLRLNGMLIARDDGQNYIWSIVEDITERNRIEADLRIAATVFDSQEGMMVTDARGVIMRVNQGFTDTTGYTAGEAVGQMPSLLKSGRHNTDFYHAMWDSINRTGGWRGEIWDRRKNGEVYPKWLTISAVKGDDGTVTHYIGTHFDITERKLAEEKIRELAFFDQLTGLPNRTLLLDRLKQAMTASARSESHGALLFIDLDNFKTLNDTLGHDMGDLLLKQVAQRLTTCMREADTVARLGGDEFVVILADLGTSEADAANATETVAEKILAVLNQSYQLGDVAHHSTASIGATLFRGKRASIDDLMKQADLAMYRSKAAGRNAVRFFDPGMESAVIKRAALETDLRNAIQEKQFLLHYQAQVVGAGRVTGAEALVRWQHPERGMVSPADFIPLAEETGLILPLGHWVLETACTQLALWATRPGMTDVTIAVNVSAHQFRQSDFVDQVLAALSHTGANPQRLKLELTESLLVENVEEIIEKMFALKAEGVGFALDDFGTGYSSLSYLKRLPLDQLKIDQSFVRDVLSDPNDAAIARTIVALAQSLSLGVIAEGVETATQKDFLASAGCHAYQGYFFSRPLPINGFEEFAQRCELAQENN